MGGDHQECSHRTHTGERRDPIDPGDRLKAALIDRAGGRHFALRRGFPPGGRES